LYVDPEYGKGAFTDGNRFWSKKNIQKIPSDRDLNFSQEKKPQTCAKWDEVAMLTRKEKLIRSVRAFIKERKT